MINKNSLRSELIRMTMGTFALLAVEKISWVGVA